MFDALFALRRRDKWFLGGGKGAIYAPPFPKWLLSPGFWDEVYLADLRIPRLFTVLLLDSKGRPVRLRGELMQWRPDRLEIEHVGEGLRLRERRCVTEGNAWVSELTLLEGAGLDAFVWTLLDLRPSGPGAPWQSVGDVGVGERSLTFRWDTAWPGELAPDRTAVEAEQVRSEGPMQAALPIWLEVGVSQRPGSWTVNLAQRHDEAPLWETSMLPTKWREGRLPGDMKVRVGPGDPEGLLHGLQHFRLEQGVPVRVAATASLRPDTRLDAALAEDVFEQNERAWRRYFAGVPQFESEDPYLTNAYWYRWYGLRLNTVDLPDLPICGKSETFAPFVTEGIGFFRNFVSYSAQAHLREVLWMEDPSLAIGILDNLARVQREDGSFPGHNYSCRPGRDFYHTDFGTPMLQLHRRHPGAVTREHTAMLRRYADYLVRHRTLSKDPAGPTLYDVFDQNETGQEYMSRYQFASEDADKWASFRVSGVDATVYAYHTFRALAELRAADSTYRAFAEGARRGLQELALQDGFYCDRLPDGRLSPARPLTGLYAWTIDGLATDFDRWVAEFEAPAGIAATALSDPTFSAEGEWKGKRLNCPWNGRSWPMANSHFVEAVRAAASTEEQRAVAERVLHKAIRLLFHDADPARPNSYEHYDPQTGTPALYRGYDDYMHSWVVGLILGGRD